MSNSLMQRFNKRQSTAMSIEKQPSKAVETKQQSLLEGNDLKIVIHNGESKKFHFLAQQPIGPLVPGQPATILWKQPVPIVQGVRKRIMVFRQLRYLISNWTGDQFPSVIYLTVDGISGFNDIQGVATQRVVALQLDQVTPVLDDATLRTHDLKYVQIETQSWNLPPTITQIKLRAKIDNQAQPIPLPLPNPMSISFQLRAQM